MPTAVADAVAVAAGVDAVAGGAAPELVTVEATFAFVDLAGFTALTDTHGDTEAVAAARGFQERVRAVLAPEDELVKTIGDAVMLRFADGHRAVAALDAIMSSELAAADARLLVRAGAHHGSAVAVDGDYYGATINLAARVAAHARGGQLLVTEHVAGAARDAGAAISHLGAVALRNVAAPVDVYDVWIAARSPMHAGLDPVCQMRVPADGTSPMLRWQGRDVWFCGLPCLAHFASTR
jgi:adenylate cyclase